MMGGGGGGGGDTETTVRYAPYVEAHHQTFLDEIASQVAIALPNSPFAGYTPIDYLCGFFGVGYTLCSFPSLYDMYGKFMAGLDIDALYTQILEDSINNPAIDNLVSDHASELSDDIIQNASPRFVTGMRDINSVVSSSFIVGKAMMETARTKSIAKYDASLRFAMLPIASQRWSDHLKWNKDVVSVYAEFLKFYFSSAMDLDNHNYSVTTKDALWPFTVLEYQRAALGAMQGASNSKSDVAGASTTGKVIGGALSGAVGGAMIGASYGSAVPGYGTLIGAGIGAVVGGAAAYFS
jgi:hypothetical protein